MRLTGLLVPFPPRKSTRRHTIEEETTNRACHFHQRPVRRHQSCQSQSTGQSHEICTVYFIDTPKSTHWICAQRSLVRLGEFRVDCCGSSIYPRSHQIPMMSIFQSTGPRAIGGWDARFAVTGLSLVEQLYEDAIFHTFFPRSSIHEVGDNHGFCLQPLHEFHMMTFFYLAIEGLAFLSFSIPYGSIDSNRQVDAHWPPCS